jgi:pre-mRNA-splicing factor ATP-dependent RNA helicase DHX38/PRP16
VHGALDNVGELTALGRKMSDFPMDPAMAKMLIQSVDYGCSEEMLTVVSMLSVPSVFYRPKERMEESDQARERFHVQESDHLSAPLSLLLTCLANSPRSAAQCLQDVGEERVRSLGWPVCADSHSRHSCRDDWAGKHFLHGKILRKAREVRMQLLDIMKTKRLPVVSCSTDWEKIRCATLAVTVRRLLSLM